MVFQCHRSLGSVYLLRENKPALALRCFRDALSVCGAQHSWYLEADVLREMSQVCVCVSVRVLAGRYTRVSVAVVFIGTAPLVEFRRGKVLSEESGENLAGKLPTGGDRGRSEKA